MSKYISDLMRKFFLTFTCLCILVSPVSAQPSYPNINSPIEPYPYGQSFTDARQCTELLMAAALLLHPSSFQCTLPVVGQAIRTTGTFAVDYNNKLALLIVGFLGLKEGAVTGPDLIGLTIILAGLTGYICPIPVPVIMAKLVAWVNQLSGVGDFAKKQAIDRLNACDGILSKIGNGVVDCAYTTCNFIQDPVHQPKAPSPVNLGDGPGVLYGKN